MICRSAFPRAMLLLNTAASLAGCGVVADAID
jgi:hypothetical protein